MHLCVELSGVLTRAASSLGDSLATACEMSAEAISYRPRTSTVPFCGLIGLVDGQHKRHVKPVSSHTRPRQVRWQQAGLRTRGDSRMVVHVCIGKVNCAGYIYGYQFYPHRLARGRRSRSRERGRRRRSASASRTCRRGPCETLLTPAGDTEQRFRLCQSLLLDG